MTKSFSLGAVLSTATGTLLCPIEELYEILNYMTDDNLFTHQLPRAGRECAPAVFAQHPQLREVDVSTVTRENWKEHLARWEAQFGATIAIEPLAEHGHEYIDPMSELAEKVHPERIIVVKS